MTSAVIVISCPLGFYVFEDREMKFMDAKDESDTVFLPSLRLISAFKFENPDHAAATYRSVEQEYQMPRDLAQFFSKVISDSNFRLQHSRWAFISQVLGQLVAQENQITWNCLPASAQRVVYSSLPAILQVDKAVIDAAATELSSHLFDIGGLDEAAEFEPYEEEDDNPAEHDYYQRHPEMQSDD